MQTGETLLYSGSKDDAHLSDVAMMLRNKVAVSLISYSPVNDRIITARFNSCHIRTTTVQVYAPKNDAKDVFHEQLQTTTDKIPKHNIVLLMEDWNAKVGDQKDSKEGSVVCHHRLHRERSENGEFFVELCPNNNLVITTTLFSHKDIHKHLWVSPDTPTRNQIDHVCGKFRRSVHSVRKSCIL